MSYNEISSLIWVRWEAIRVLGSYYGGGKDGWGLMYGLIWWEIGLSGCVEDYISGKDGG